MLRIPPPIQTLVAAGLMISVNAVVPLNVITSSPTRYILCALFLISAVLILSLALIEFVRHKTTVNPIQLERSSALVVNGAYRFSRNPMYLGMLLLLLALEAWLANPWTLFVLVGFVWLMNTIQIKPEEAAMEKLFGNQYRRYRQKVRRWL